MSLKGFQRKSIGNSWCETFTGRMPTQRRKCTKGRKGMVVITGKNNNVAIATK